MFRNILCGRFTASPHGLLGVGQMALRTCFVLRRMLRGLWLSSAIVKRRSRRMRGWRAFQPIADALHLSGGYVSIRHSDITFLVDLVSDYLTPLPSLKSMEDQCIISSMV